MKRRFCFLLLIIGMCRMEVMAQLNNAGLLVEKSIELPGRVRLSYVEQGSQDGIPVIFLHGFPDSWYSYATVLPYLPSSIHAYVLSQRGHGNSDRPETGYRPEDLAEDAAAFIKELRIPRAIIVGHSMGATVTQCFAIRYPDLMRGMVLIGSLATFHTKPELIEFNKMVTALNDPIDRRIPYEFQKSTLFKEVSPGFFDTLMNESMKVPARVWKGVVNGLLNTDYTRQLKSIRKPTLLVWGEKDAFALRKDQEIILSAITGSRLEVYKGTGHSVQWEEPKRFAQDLVAFVRMIAP